MRRRGEYDSEWIAGIGFHIAVEVPSIEEGLRFYCDLLGMEQDWSCTTSGELAARLYGVRDARASVAQLICPGGSRVQLIAWEPSRSRGETWSHRLSLGVRDVEAMGSRLRAAGVRFSCDPFEIADGSHPLAGWCVARFADPWGNALQLLGPSPARSLDNGERAAVARI